MTAALVVVAILVGLVGLLMTSSATAGPAIVGFACLLAIVARINQAGSMGGAR
mgnify:CR=1 FL=1